MNEENQVNQNNQGYVYSKRTVKLKELEKLLGELSGEKTYYFLRSPHMVSGICMEPPKQFPTTEGQMFNANCELRWKKCQSGYDVLILSKNNFTLGDFKLEGFEKVSGNWETSDFKAYLYENETQFPKKFVYKKLKNENIKPKDISIGQRYFQDKDTTTVHFIALTVLQKTANNN